MVSASPDVLRRRPAGLHGLAVVAAVLEGWAGRVAMVRVFLCTVTPDVLAASPEPARFRTPRDRPFLLHVILNEEWQYLRHAARDPDAIDAGQTG
jgi:hypothetical protein